MSGKKGMRSNRKTVWSSGYKEGFVLRGVYAMKRRLKTKRLDASLDREFGPEAHKARIDWHRQYPLLPKRGF